jgi:hypothetical protein
MAASVTLGQAANKGIVAGEERHQGVHRVDSLLGRCGGEASHARQHQLRFTSSLVVEATDAIAPEEYRGDGAAIDGSMVYVAAIASGHMLA